MSPGVAGDEPSTAVPYQTPPASIAGMSQWKRTSYGLAVGTGPSGPSTPALPRSVAGHDGGGEGVGVRLVGVLPSQFWISTHHVPGGRIGDVAGSSAAGRCRDAHLGRRARRVAGADEQVDVGHLGLEGLGDEPGRPGRHVDEVDVDLGEVVVGVGAGRVLDERAVAASVAVHHAEHRAGEVGDRDRVGCRHDLRAGVAAGGDVDGLGEHAGRRDDGDRHRHRRHGRVAGVSVIRPNRVAPDRAAGHVGGDLDVMAVARRHRGVAERRRRARARRRPSADAVHVTSAGTGAAALTGTVAVRCPRAHGEALGVGERRQVQRLRVAARRRGWRPRSRRTSRRRAGRRGPAAPTSMCPEPCCVRGRRRAVVVEDGRAGRRHQRRLHLRRASSPAGPG